MARVRGARCRLCRREGIKLYLKGIRCGGDKCAIERRNSVPGQHKMRKKISDYGVQMREKQKMKKIYGMLEKQFRIFFQRALQFPGITGEVLIQLLERRLDNVVLKMLIVPSRSEARQFIRHGFIKINKRKVDIPSYLVKEGDVISVVEKESVKKRIADNLEMLKDRETPEWISLDRKTQVATITRLPTKADAALPIEENLIVELYSK
ncbi:MAG: 30S ribosomal protein S4 [Candidatus Omnitrophica bacterium]|nr:30S ribosomal protein S4 [Candidatus Omnitrophota bacterium]